MTTKAKLFSITIAAITVFASIVTIISSSLPTHTVSAMSAYTVTIQVNPPSSSYIVDATLSGPTYSQGYASNTNPNNYNASTHVFTFNGVPGPADYSWSVSAAYCQGSSANMVAVDNNMAITATLTPLTYQVIFSCDPETWPWQVSLTGTDINGTTINKTISDDSTNQNSVNLIAGYYTWNAPDQTAYGTTYQCVGGSFGPAIPSVVSVVYTAIPVTTPPVTTPPVTTPPVTTPPVTTPPVTTPPVTTPPVTTPPVTTPPVTTPAAPTISGVVPNSGPSTGGTPITITGTAFTSPSTVSIGSGSATSVTVVNSTTITAITPSGMAVSKR